MAVISFWGREPVSASSRTMTHTSQAQPGPGRPRLRFRNTLAFRVALAVNLAVIGALGVFAAIDYRRERAIHLRQTIARLGEEASVLSVARTHAPDRMGFQRFIDDFCRQMGSAASPGHHIIVLDGDGDGDGIMRAHERANLGLEAKMAETTQDEPSRFQHQGKGYLSVAATADDGSTIIVAQSLAPVERIIRAQRISRLMSLGMVVVLVSGVTVIGVLVWVRRPLRTLVAGVAAMGRGQFDVRVPSAGSAELRYLAEGINGMAHSLGKVEARRQAEMKKAQGIQRGLLPRGDHDVSGFDIATIFLPTDSVGGDLYDIVELQDGSTLVAVMDVSGHGVAAALCTALLRTVLRHAAVTTCDMTRIAEAMNRELSGIAGHGEFATCFYARLLDGSGRVEYLSAGHDPAVIVRANGEKELLAGSGLPLGIEEGTGYQLRQSPLRSGDRLFLYTDGLHEVFDPHSRPLGRDSLEDLLVGTRELPVDEQLDAVVQKVRTFQGKTKFADDVTLLCLHRRAATELHHEHDVSTRIART